MGRAATVVGALLGTVAALPAAAPAAPLSEARVETVRDPAQVLSSGAGQHTLRLRPGGAATTRVRDVAADRLKLRVRRHGRCSTPLRLIARVDGKRVLSRTLRGRGARTLSADVDLQGGDHRVDVVASRRSPRGRCRAEVRVSSIDLEARRRRVPIGSALHWPAISNDDYRDTFLREFDSLTPENELKMILLRPEGDNRYAFTAADQMVAFAEQTGKEVRGHTLVWGLAIPSWLSTRSFTQTGLTNVMRDHIITVVGRYRGRIGEWDVVNEPMAEDGSLAANLWSTTIGPSYIETALRTAHAADPDAKLFVNEISTELNERKFAGLLDLARGLLQRGVPLHGIGLQNHAHVDNAPSRARLADQMRRIGALGLEAQITEMDVSRLLATKTPGERVAERQTQIYGDAAEACNEVPACTRMTVWGVGDRLSWIGPAADPLLFDDDWVAKPALGVVRSAFARR